MRSVSGLPAAGGKRLVASGGEVYNRPSNVSTNPASGLGFVAARRLSRTEFENKIKLRSQKQND